MNLVETIAAGLEAGQRFCFLPSSRHPRVGRVFTAERVVQTAAEEPAVLTFGNRPKPATVTIVTAGAVFNVSPDTAVGIVP